MCFFFQAEDGIRDLVRSRGLGDVYKRQELYNKKHSSAIGYNFDFDCESFGKSCYGTIRGLHLSLIHI